MCVCVLCVWTPHLVEQALTQFRMGRQRVKERVLAPAHHGQEDDHPEVGRGRDGLHFLQPVHHRGRTHYQGLNHTPTGVLHISSTPSPPTQPPTPQPTLTHSPTHPRRIQPAGFEQAGHIPHHTPHTKQHIQHPPHRDNNINNPPPETHARAFPGSPLHPCRAATWATRRRSERRSMAWPTRAPAKSEASAAARQYSEVSTAAKGVASKSGSECVVDSCKVSRAETIY